MRLNWIASAALAMGVTAVPSFAHADYRDYRDHRDDRGRVEVKYDRYDRDDRYRDERRDFDRDVNIREVPHNVLDTLRDTTRGGRVLEVQYVFRDGKYFYRFQVDGRRDDQSVRIGANGRLLSVEEVAQCDAGWHRR